MVSVPFLLLSFNLHVFSRGDDFRVAFSKLGTVRSILPNHVNVLALTATATEETFKCVKDRLAMKDVKVIGIHPGRANIKYIVKPSINVNELSLLLTTELSKLRTKVPKTVIFCHTLLQCANLLKSLKRDLKLDITEPPGMPVTDIQYRMVDVFTSGSTSEMRDAILQEFCKKNTSLRIIIATNAFGLGVDCADITRVIHWGPPSTLEELAQETGRAGRDGSPSEAILYYKKFGKFLSNPIKNYGENSSTCRRKMMFQNFLFTSSTDYCESPTACRCCDLCAPLCNCSNCS